MTESLPFQLGSALSEEISTRKDINTIKLIRNQLIGARKLKKIEHLKIIEDPANSITWLAKPDGTPIRKICGHRYVKGICLMSAGWATNHPGFGKCLNHSRGNLYNATLSMAHGFPARLSELLDHTESLEESDLQNVDNEIKMLYALQQYIMGKVGEQGDLTPGEIDTIVEITNNIVKTKTIKNKIQRELRLDATSVREFVEQIFGIITNHIKGPEAKNVMNDILNRVIIPFRSKERISPGDFKSTAGKFVKDAELD